MHCRCFGSLVVLSALLVVNQVRAETEAGVTVVTWNVLADTRYVSDRIPALLREVGALEPDIVAFQEVRRWFLTYVSRDPVLSRYALSASFLQGEPSGGLLILTKAPVSNMRFVPLPSRMFRGVLLVDVALPSGSVAVAVVHFESNLKGVDARSRQLRRTVELLEGKPDYLIVGDFNFGDGEPENDAIPTGVVDVWPLLREGEDGCTFDTVHNRLAKENSLLIERNCRYDRVLVASPRLEPLSVEFVGATPFRGKLHPSDHYGLVARFRVKDRR